MDSLEQRIEQAVNNRVDSVLRNLTDYSLRIRIRQQAQEIAKTADFTDSIRERFATIDREAWFETALIERVQQVLDTSLLSYLEARVDANLTSNEIENVVDQRVEEYVESEQLVGVVREIVLQKVKETIESEQMKAAIEEVILEAVQKRLDHLLEKRDMLRQL